MEHDLRRLVLRSGALIDGATGLPVEFGQPDEELRAALSHCALVDRSDLGRIVATGPDVLDLLNRLSTGKVVGLPPGTGAQTVITTAKGRIVERLFVHVLGPREVLLVGGPRSAERVIEHLRRFTFREDTGLVDRTEALCQLALLGPAAREALAAAGLAVPAAGGSLRVEFEGQPVHLLGEDGWSADGLSIVVERAGAGAVWRALNLAVGSVGGRAAGSRAASAWRVLRGLPETGHELTEDANPLEAGLRAAVSFDKGCYVGQEVVARLNTYDKVARELCGFVLPPGAPAPAFGSLLFFQDAEVGRITSALVPPGFPSAVALGYLKRRVAEPGLEVAVGRPDGDVRARMTVLPFND